MNPNNTQNQNNYQGQIPNNNIQYQSNNQIPIGQPVQQYQQYQQQSQQFSMPQQQGVQAAQANQPRTISPEEVLQAQHPMTQQELQRTQVLNIEEVEKAARYERISSKKPAIAVAVLGVLFLAFGTTFQVATNLKASNNKVEKRDIAEEVVEKEETVKVVESNLKCTQSSFNNADGTDTEYTIQYNFEDDKLVGFTKTYAINPTVGNQLGATTVQNYSIAYQQFMNPTDGYQIEVVPNGEGLLVTVVVDFKTLDLTLLNPTQQNHFSTSVDYPLETAKEKIQTDMVTNGLICE